MIKRLSIAIGTAAVLLPTSASAQGYGPQMMGWGGWGFGPIIGPFFMILVLAAIVATVVLLVRAVSGPQVTSQSYQGPSGRRSLDILKERFARGEIDKNEFEERRRVLGE
jgi:putative membrane protein